MVLQTWWQGVLSDCPGFREGCSVAGSLAGRLEDLRRLGPQGYREPGPRSCPAGWLSREVIGLLTENKLDPYRSVPLR